MDFFEEKQIKIFCRNVELKFISEKDKSMYDALAKGFRLITGDVVAYINADDYYLGNSFSTIAEIFTKLSSVALPSGKPSRMKAMERGGKRCRRGDGSDNCDFARRSAISSDQRGECHPPRLDSLPGSTPSCFNL